MSQAKVDKYKEYKANKAEILKKQNLCPAMHHRGLFQCSNPPVHGNSPAGVSAFHNFNRYRYRKPCTYVADMWRNVTFMGLPLNLPKAGTTRDRSRRF